MWYFFFWYFLRPIFIIKICSYTIFICFYFCFYVFIIIVTISSFSVKVIFINFSIFFRILLKIFKSCISLIIRVIVILLLSNLLIYSVVCERNKCNGLITLSSLYPKKYLNELCFPYCSFLETNILLTSISSILNIFLFFKQKSLFF